MVTVQGCREQTDEKACRPAFTLVESVMSLLIVAVMLVAALDMVGSSAQARLVQSGQARGLALAGELMSEILQAAYRDPVAVAVFGPESDEVNGTRSAFDDVDDYNGWRASPPQWKGGGTINDYSGWIRSVVVCYANPTQPASNASSDVGLKRITVTVTSDTGEIASLVALRAENGNYDTVADSGITLIGSMSMRLGIGDDVSPILSGVNLLNEVEGEPSPEIEPDNHAPVAVIVTDRVSGFAPLTVWFWGGDSQDSDSGDTLTYSWDFGDGTTGSGEMVSHVYWSMGTFNATLTVLDPSGASGTASVTIKVGL